ncbi:DUF1642 domain-containing protein [Tetragenococcus halophilus]|uniref:DUF1642 domain-containing protein n=1 Tax=Tetragenococcus halophilus TaxID=51669 RepID=UPI00209BB855|nr:DUF1642 domain-containing protein [Tetragenococcus halophilus]MCO8296607.1 DUF1642 domain-containing protein [Tetragenococcus halophilus]
MDKQELLDVLEEQIIKEKEEKDAYGETDTWIGGYKDGQIYALTFAAKKAEWLDEPEKPEIPQFVEKEIPSAPKEALDRYYNPGVYIVPPYSYKVINWIEGHFDIFLQALFNGFEIQKQPVWVIKTFAGYLTKFETFVNNNWRAKISSSKDDKDIITFECKEKANEIATLIDGVVEEWSE